MPSSSGISRLVHTGILAGLLLFPMTARAGGPEAPPHWSGPVLALREDSWSASIDLLGPRGDFDKQFRDIDLYGLTLGRSWRFGYGLELRALASGVVARGERSEPFSPNPPLHSDAEGLAFGGGLRQYLLDWQGFHLFAEGSVQFLWTMGTPFPGRGQRRQWPRPLGGRRGL